MSNLQDQFETAIQEALASRTVIVTSVSTNVEHGSGVTVGFGGKKFIITAAHVIKPQANDQIRLIGRPKGPLRFPDRQDLDASAKTGQLAIDSVSTPTKVPITRRILGKEDEDIAALEIVDSDAYLPDTTFHDLTCPDATLVSPGRDVVLFGFPGEIAPQIKHRPSGRLGALGLPYVDQVRIRKISDAPDKLDPSV